MFSSYNELVYFKNCLKIKVYVLVSGICGCYKFSGITVCASKLSFKGGRGVTFQIVNPLFLQDLI